MKNRAEMPVGKYQVSEKPWQLVLKGHDSILIVCNRFSKISHFVVTTEKTIAEGLARLFRDYVWKLHRLPESVISDREL